MPREHELLLQGCIPTGKHSGVESPSSSGLKWGKASLGPLQWRLGRAREGPQGHTMEALSVRNMKEQQVGGRAQRLQRF